MKKKTIIIYVIFMIGLFLVLFNTARETVAKQEPQKETAQDYPQVRETILNTFPKLGQVGEITKTEIPGLYEIEVGSNILYFYPEKSLMVFGEIWSKEGESLTAESRARLTSKKIKDIPLAKALKIGEGKNVIIEFTDPDCPYCRKASEFLKGRKDTTRYVFFAPMPFHKDAESKVKFILCSENKAQVYEEVMAGKYDGQRLETCNSEQVSALIGEHKEIAKNTGISATPTFWINGEHVSGANIPVIEKLLTKIN